MLISLTEIVCSIMFDVELRWVNYTRLFMGLVTLGIVFCKAHDVGNLYMS